jgi:benzodiazapine receptor
MSLFYGPDEGAARRPLLAFVLCTLFVGAGGTVFSEPAIRGWYAELVHPVLTPPNWVFPWVWTTLYIMMAVAAWRVWRIVGIRSTEMATYAIQLGLNFLWSVIFFGRHRIGAAFAEILILDLAIVATAILFFRRDRLAGLMLLPYLAWSLYASILTHDLALLNP